MELLGFSYKNCDQVNYSKANHNRSEVHLIPQLEIEQTMWQTCRFWFLEKFQKSISFHFINHWELHTILFYIKQVSGFFRSSSFVAECDSQEVFSRKWSLFCSRNPSISGTLCPIFAKKVGFCSPREQLGIRQLALLFHTPLTNPLLLFACCNYTDC